jgi:hypothetical protein
VGLRYCGFFGKSISSNQGTVGTPATGTDLRPAQVCEV